MKLEKEFKNLSYDKKRKLYRRYARENGFAYEMKLFIMSEISQGMPTEILKEVEIERYLYAMLVDGYVAFERLFDSKQEHIIGYQQIDPVTLTAHKEFSTENNERKNIWIQYNDKPELKKILTDDQILYVSYPLPDANDSLIGQLYTKQIKLYNNERLNDFMISYIIKKIKTQLIDIINKERDFFKN